MSAAARDDRALRAAGSAGAILCALLPLAALAVTLGRLMHDAGWRGPPPHDATVHALVLAGAGAAAALGLALAASVAAARSQLGGGRVGLAGAALGGLGGLALLGSAALAAAGEAAGGAASPWSVRLAEAAPVLAGAWALFAVAIAWRVRRWPAWLRVTGAIWGATEMMLPAIPPLGPLALLVGLAWWTGLAVQLARGAPVRAPVRESTSP